MARQKKIKIVQVEQKKEEVMKDSAILEAPTKINDEKELDSIQNEIDLARLELEKTKKQIEETKSQLNSIRITPSREIDAEERAIVEKQISMSNERSCLKEKIERQRKIDSELITGRFMNRYRPGQPVKLPYIKYDTDPVKWNYLEDGKVYTIPRGFANQLNGGTDEDPCYYSPQFKQKQSEMDPNRPSSAIHSVDASNKKFAFVPVGF